MLLVTAALAVGLVGWWLRPRPPLVLPQALDATAYARRVADPDAVARGGVTWRTRGYCGVCHGARGEGAAQGPNLSDDVWLHGARYTEVAHSIANGFPPRMYAWKGTFSPEEIAELVAFVASLRGTNGDRGKMAEGVPAIIGNEPSTSTTTP